MLDRTTAREYTHPMKARRTFRDNVHRSKMPENPPIVISQGIFIENRTLRVVKTKTSETLKASALLVVFVAGAIAGILLVWLGFGVWKLSGFSFAGWRIATTDVASARFFVIVGCFAFVTCVLCVVHLLRYDLAPKKK